MANKNSEKPTMHIKTAGHNNQLGNCKTYSPVYVINTRRNTRYNGCSTLGNFVYQKKDKFRDLQYPDKN